MNTKKQLKREHPKIEQKTKTTKTTTVANLFSGLPQEAAKVLEDYNEIVQSCKPLNSKQSLLLPRTIRDLSHQLTDERPERRTGYMNETAVQQAYIRYFSWWNLVRLTRIFAGLPSNAFDYLHDNSVILDIGSGPLTVISALWITRPELRSQKLVCYCLDLSPSVMAMGENIFLSIASRLPGKCEPWRIIRVKGSLGTFIQQKASLVTCANMFNELFWDSPKPLEELAKKYSETLLKYTASVKKPVDIVSDSGQQDKEALNDSSPFAVFVAEPGVPRSSRFVSLLRDALIRKKCQIVSPCPHMASCPMDGRKGGKWCHFTFSTENAPNKLLKLSKDAGIPKERATISFVFACSAANENEKLSSFEVSNEKAFNSSVNDRLKSNNIAHNDMSVRIVSDSIRLPYNKSGRYACTERGLALVIETPHCPVCSGSLAAVKTPVNPVYDQKTGAIELML